MKTNPKALAAATLGAAALVASVGPATAQPPEAKPTPPSVAYWHVWTDKDGVSHQRKEALHDFEFKTIEPPAAPMWIDKLPGAGASVTVLVMPVGWQGEWHENPHRQWIVPLSGRWFVETMDGQRVEMGPGEISFGEDQGTRTDAKGHKGHLSGTVGDVPFVAMLVQLPDVPTSEQPTHFK